jgi:ADP-heptose:LPS heptosyltransferase
MYFGKHNYLQLMHAMADVPYAPRTKFYASHDERERAEAYVKAANAPVVLWALAGSSVHKAYPHMDNVIAALMLNTKAHVVLVGDDVCKILEYGWENEPRVHCKSGELSIRETLALAQACNVVVGPETGILNAVAYEANGKVLMLSHSSKRNLSEDWKNTTSLEPKKCPCYPCHKLHYGKETCNIDEDTGASLCAARIAPERVYEAIVKHIERRR